MSEYNTHQAEAEPTTSPEFPRDAIMAGFQDFVLGEDVLAAHDKALREYRKRDRAGYVDHLYAMTTDNSMPADELGVEHTSEDARDYAQRALNYENLRSDIEAYADEKKQKALDLGHAALFHTKTVTVGIGKSVYNAVDRKVFQLQATYSYRKHERELQSNAKANAKQQEREARREQRVAKIEAFKERFTSPVRKAGNSIITAYNNVYLLGLDVTNPTKAAEIRHSLETQRAARKRAALEQVLSNINPEIQTERVMDLLLSDYAPEEQFDTDDSSTGLLSNVFRSASKPEMRYAVMYQQQDDGQILPRLMYHRHGHGAWKADDGLLPDGAAAFVHGESAVLNANEILLGANPKNDKYVSDTELGRLISQLTFNRTNKTPETESVYRQRRYQLLAEKARRQAKQAKRKAARQRAANKATANGSQNRQPRTPTPDAKAA